MLKRGLINFLKGLKYYFTPLGVWAIFFFIAIVVCFGGIGNAISGLVNKLGTTVTDNSINWGIFSNSVWQEFKGLNGNYAQVVDKTWISNTLLKAFSDCGVSDAVRQAMNDVLYCTEEIVKNLILFVVLNVVGIVTGYFVVSMLVRSTMVKSAWWRKILYTLLNTITTILINALMIFICALWTPFIFIYPVIALLLSYILATLEAYLIHGYKKVRMKNILNFKVMLLKFLCDLLILAIVVGIVTVFFMFVNVVIAVILGIPLLEITLVVMNHNAESFVLHKIDEAKVSGDLPQSKKAK